MIKEIQEWLDHETTLHVYPSPILRAKSLPIDPADAKQVADRMFDIMYKNKGIGLAANQVGLPYQIFVLNRSGDNQNTSEEHVLLNPIITKPSQQIRNHDEGCLSLPGITGEVSRPFSVVMEYEEITGKKKKANYAGLFARVVQHETDHLNGVLFIDHLTIKEKERIKLDSLLAKFG